MGTKEPGAGSTHPFLGNPPIAVEGATGACWGGARTGAGKSDRMGAGMGASGGAGGGGEGDVRRRAAASTSSSAGKPRTDDLPTGGSSPQYRTPLNDKALIPIGGGTACVGTGAFRGVKAGKGICAEETAETGSVIQLALILASDSAKIAVQWLTAWVWSSGRARCHEKTCLCQHGSSGKKRPYNALTLAGVTQRVAAFHSSGDRVSDLAAVVAFESTG